MFVWMCVCMYVLVCVYASINVRGSVNATPLYIDHELRTLDSGQESAARPNHILKTLSSCSFFRSLRRRRRRRTSSSSFHVIISSSSISCPPHFPHRPGSSLAPRCRSLLCALRFGLHLRQSHPSDDATPSCTEWGMHSSGTNESCHNDRQ